LLAINEFLFYGYVAHWLNDYFLLVTVAAQDTPPEIDHSFQEIILPVFISINPEIFDKLYLSLVFNILLSLQNGKIKSL